MLALEDKVLTAIPFDSSYKFQTTVIRKEDGGVRVYTKGAPDVLYGKDEEEVKRLVQEELEANTSLTPEEALARADKRAGYGMVTHVTVPGGTEDWYAQCNSDIQLKSLRANMKLGGREG